MQIKNYLDTVNLQYTKHASKTLHDKINKIFLEGSEI